MGFPQIEQFAPLNAGLTIVRLVGGCKLYIPYSHNVDIDILHEKLNQFAFEQHVASNTSKVGEEGTTDIFEMADIVYEWLDNNNPEKQK